MNRANEMRELLARWKKTDLSLMAFGKQEGIPYSMLLYWRRKLSRQSTGRVAPPKNAASVTFSPVRILPDQPPLSPKAAGTKYGLLFSNGVTLDVPSGFDDQELRRLVEVLLSC